MVAGREHAEIRRREGERVHRVANGSAKKLRSEEVGFPFMMAAFQPGSMNGHRMPRDDEGGHHSGHPATISRRGVPCGKRTERARNSETSESIGSELAQPAQVGARLAKDAKSTRERRLPFRIVTRGARIAAPQRLPATVAFEQRAGLTLRRLG